MGGAVFGRGTALYLFLQFTTMAILFLAANTAFADFPRLSSIIASDGFLPRQLAHRGDRLVFSTACSSWHSRPRSCLRSSAAAPRR